MEEVTAGPEGSEFVLLTHNPPVLCTGFEGSVASAVASHLFDFADASDEAKGCLCTARVQYLCTSGGLASRNTD